MAANSRLLVSVCVFKMVLLAAGLLTIDAAASITAINQLADNSLDSSPAAPSQSHGGRKYAPVGADRNVLDQFSHRYPDGSYEFRYELADGTARYERGYFVLIDQVKSLVVLGYYAYRAPDGRYITVFYNADRHGYRQNQSITQQVYPNLPRSIAVPSSPEAGPLQGGDVPRPILKAGVTTGGSHL